MCKNSVAVIVLNHNKKKDVLECLKSVYEQDYKNYNIVVVDNASTDDSVKVIRNEYPSLSIFQNDENTGAGPGRNIGWEYSESNFQYDYLLFLDDDVILGKNFISRLVEVLSKNSNVGIVCGKAYTHHASKIIMSAGIHINLYTGSIYDLGSGEKDIGQFNNSGYTDACGGFAMMIRRELFNKIGGFNHHYAPYGWEDVDLCLRAKENGSYTFYLPEAVLIHKGTKLGRKPNPVYEKSKVQNYFYLLKAHTNAIQKVTIGFCLPFRASILVFKMIYKGNAKIITELFKGFFSGINNLMLSIKSNK